MKKISITMEMDTLADKHANAIIKISDDINTYLKSRSFGDGIEFIFIGFICIMQPEGYEGWFKERKPRYTEKFSFMLKDGTTVEYNKKFSFDLKIYNEDYDYFVGLNEGECKKYLAEEILKSLVKLDKIPKRVKDFDKEKFKEAVRQYFIDEKVI